jgi:hypothetical protein
LNQTRPFDGASGATKLLNSISVNTLNNNRQKNWTPFKTIKNNKLAQMKSLKLIYTNIDSLLNKRQELNFIVQKLKPHLICLTETLPKNCRSNCDDQEIKIENYTTLTNHNSSSCQRGVAIFVHISLKSSMVTFDTIASESISCEVQTKNSKLLITTFYRSPNSNEENDNYINQHITNLSEKYTNILIVGDFNYPDITWSNQKENPISRSSKSSRFIDSIHNSFLKQHITKPTHFRNDQNPTTIDLIITSMENSISSITHLAPIGKSHHQLLYFTLIMESNDTSIQTTNKYLFSRGNYNNINNDLSALVLDQNYNTEQLWNIFYTNLKNTISKNVPKSSIKNKKRSQWINAHVAEEIRNKQIKYQDYIRKRNSKTYHEYCLARNRTNATCRNAIINFEKGIAKNINKNPKAFFSYIKSKKLTKDLIPEIVHNKTVATTDLEKAQCFNNYFASNFSDNDTSILPSFNLSSVCPNQLSNDLDLSPLNIESHLISIKSFKSPGPDEIHPRILKETYHQISKHLSTIYSKVFQTSILPQIWKDANIIPIFKKGDKKLVTNYRPISLTCTIVKVFEKIIQKHIFTHLLKNNLLSPSQHGFHPGRSCETNLLTVINAWTLTVDKGIPIDNIYLDFEKAFDKVPHQHLLVKLRAYGINGRVLDWIGNFLIGRRQRVKINGKYSDWVQVKSGVPQGSVLSALLFIIYVNDIPNLISSNAALFADDTKIFYPLTSMHSHTVLQNDIDILVDWATKWGMRFNIEKCSVLHLGYKNKHHVYTMYDPVKQTRNNIKSTNSETDLGIHVDNKLLFSKHTSMQVNKAIRMVFLIKRSFSYLNSFCFKRLFSALVRPYLEYCGSVYNPRLLKDKRQVENVLRKASKSVHGLQNLSYQQRLLKINLTTMRYRLIRGDLINVYKWLNSYYNCKTILPKTNINFITRGHSFKLEKPYCRLASRQNFFTIRIINKWNSLPNDVVNASSLISFKNKLDGYLKDEVIIYD